jgi:hypothetical protein
MSVLWVLLLQVLVLCVRAEDYSGLRGAVRHVEDALRKEMMIQPVRYSDPNVTLSYEATAQFNARGMANLYKVTNFFMDIIQREDPYPEGKFQQAVSLPASKRNVGSRMGREASRQNATGPISEPSESNPHV